MIEDDEGVILEEDSDDEGYMFAGQGKFLIFIATLCISNASLLDS